jgi:uncharacterized membrane protein YphA (DoxX/SURF4 family)
MDDSMAQPQPALASMTLPGWKTTISWVCAVVVGLVFLISGIWKITDTQGAAVRMAQAKVPENLSLLAAFLFGIAETVAAALLLVPRFRRWGAIATSILLVAFITYIGMEYNALHGQECTCFPWLKRFVGPGFFVGDGALLLMAILAGVWAKAASGFKSAVLVLGAVTVFAGVSYGVNAVRQTGTKAPDTITVNGQPYSLQQGKIVLFYFDPECLHCLDAAKRMSHYNWGDTKVVGIPVRVPNFAGGFLEDSKLNAVISNDLDKLKAVFPFVSAPAGVVLENGHEKAPLTKFEGEEPGATLKQLGMIQ